MKKIRFFNSIRLKLLLNIQLQNAKNAEHRIRDKVIHALDTFERDVAERYFPLLIEWNDLHKATSLTLKAVSDDSILTYVVDSWFLHDLLTSLTPDADEVPVYITGPQIAGVKVLSRICGFELDHQSAVRAKGNPKACSDALIEINEHGNALHVVAHSHPGFGSSATHESGIDTKYLGKIQKAGAEAIGLILTRDGYVRFFTVEKPFQVFVRGEGAQYVQENIYKLQIHED